MKITDFSATQIGALLADKTLSAVEVVEALLCHIDAQEPRVHGYCYLDREAALAAAREFDAQTQHAGILGGIPYAIKDNMFYCGQPATAGSEALQGFFAAQDCACAAGLRQLGAINLGRANMDELAMGSSTATSFYGKSYNPHAENTTPGGSSGGSAALVAAGEAYFALGSDTGGSIRQPAAFCGVVGLKPTQGVISNAGVIPLAASFDQVGLFTKNVEDCAVLLDALAVPNLIENCAALLKQPIRGLRMGVPKEYWQVDLPADLEQKLSAALQVFAELGVEIEEVTLPMTEFALPAYHVLAPLEMAQLPAWLAAQGWEVDTNLLGSEAQRRLLLGQYFKNTGSSYVQAARVVRQKICAEFADIFQRYDVLFTPVTRGVAFNYQQAPSDALEMYKNDLLLAAANHSGICAASIPCGKLAGLPCGFQLMANRFQDAKLLQIAFAYQVKTSRIHVK